MGNCELCDVSLPICDAPWSSGNMISKVCTQYSRPMLHARKCDHPWKVLSLDCLVQLCPIFCTSSIDYMWTHLELHPCQPAEQVHGGSGRRRKRTRIRQLFVTVYSIGYGVVPCHCSPWHDFLTPTPNPAWLA